MSANRRLLRRTPGGAAPPVDTSNLPSCSFSDSGSDFEQGVTLDASVEGETGDITINADVSGKLGAGFADLASGFNRDTIDIRYVVDVPGEFDNRVRNQIQSVKNILSITPPWLPSSPRQVIPNPVRNISSDSRHLWVGIFGNKIAGQDEVSATRELPDFQPVPIPTTEQGDFSIDQLPDLTLRVEVVPKEVLQRTLSSHPTVELTIPACAFVAPLDIGGVACDDLFPQLESNIDSIRTDLESWRSSLETSQENLQSVRDRVTSAVSGSRSLRDIDPSDISSIPGDTLEEMRNNVENVNDNIADVSGARSRISSARNEVQNINLQRCSSTFESRLSDLDDILDEVSNIQSNVSNTRSDLIDILGGVSRLSCGERYDNISSGIQDLERTVGTSGFTPIIRETIDQERFEQLISNVDDVRSTVRDDLTPDDPCFDEFMGRLDSVESTARRIREDTGIGLGCADISQVIRSRVDSVATTASDFSTGDLNIRESTIRSRIQGTRETVEQRVSDDNPCKQQLLDRLNEAENRVDQGQILGCQDVDQSLRNDVNSIRDRARNVDPSNRQNVLDNIRNLRSRVRDEVSQANDCREQLLNDLDQAESNVMEVQLDCGDVPRSIRNNVGTFVSGADTWVFRDQINRRRDRKQELINEGTSVLSEINESVDDNNPCKQELRSRVRDSLSRVRSAGVRPETAIPCDERFSDVFSDVTEFERTVLDLQPPVNPATVQSISNTGQELINQIERRIPSGDPCRSELETRVRVLVNRAGRLTAQVRIDPTDAPSPSEERIQLIRDLLESLNTIRTPELPDDIEGDIDEDELPAIPQND